LIVVAACGGGGGGDDGEPDAPVVPLPCTDMPGTRLLDANAQVTGSASHSLFPGQACIADHPELPCADTAVTGQFLICVPATGGFVLEVSATGYEAFDYLHGDGTLDGLTFLTPDDSYARTSIWMPAGAAAYPPTTTAFLVLGVRVDHGGGLIGGLENAQVKVSPSPTKPTVYLDTNGLPDVSLTMTSTAGEALVADVDPGMYDVTVTGATACVLDTGAGWESPVGGAAIRIPATAGKTMAATVICQP